MPVLSWASRLAEWARISEADTAPRSSFIIGATNTIASTIAAASPADPHAADRQRRGDDAGRSRVAPAPVEGAVDAASAVSIRRAVADGITAVFIADANEAALCRRSLTCAAQDGHEAA